MQADGTCDILGSLSFVVAVEYTLPVVLHILRVDSDDKGTGYAACVSSSPAYHGMQADKICDVSVLELCGGSGIHFPGHTAHRRHMERYIELFI